MPVSNRFGPERHEDGSGFPVYICGVAFKFELAVQHDSQILLGLDLFYLDVVDFDYNVSVVDSWRCFVYHKAGTPCSNKLNVAILQKWHILMV
jgi:hypothetical protein